MAKKCIKSFGLICKESQIIEWNEQNCDLNENPYIQEAYSKGLWAFVSDYYRLKALYEYGGIYLDTDVEIKKPFSDSFFQQDLVLGYMYECTISTAVILASPKNSFIKKLLDKYSKLSLIVHQPNNVIFNDYALASYPNFRLNGKYREFAPNFVIYPRYYFETPHIGTEGGYSVHHFMGSWHGNKSLIKETVRTIFKKCRFYCFPLDYWYQNYFRNKRLKRSGYYKRYLEDLNRN